MLSRIPVLTPALFSGPRRSGIIALLGLLAACGGDSGGNVVVPPSPPPAAVTAMVEVAGLSGGMRVGQTVQLSATAKDAAGNALSGRSFTWASTSEAVASVSAGGMVTSLTPGTATIRATADGKTGEVTLSITPRPVGSVTVSPQAASIVVGATQQLTAVVYDTAGGALADRVVSWTSSDPAVAAVAANGMVSATGAGGPVTITASAEGKTGTAAITVAPVPVATVTLEPGSVSLQVGATAQFRVVARDAAGNVLVGRSAMLVSSNAAVATVDDAGVVRGVAAGTAVLTATSEGKTGTAAITVTPVPVATVALSPATASLPIGETQQLSVVARDAQGNALPGRSVTWSSSNSAIASVSAAGVVTAVAPGSATISATVEAKSGSAAVTVFRPATSVGGIVSSNTTWSRANSPYRLTQNVQIAYGATLTIEPGVEVQGASKRIEVWGVLSASGTASSPVRLDSTHVVPRGAHLQPFHIRMEHVEMRRGSLYAPTGNSERGSLILRDSRLYDLGSYLYVWYPIGENFIERNVFVRSGGISVGADTRTERVRVYIRNNTFVDWTAPAGGAYAVENWASYGGETTIVQHNSFLSTNRVALRLPSGYTDTRITATENYWGTTSESVIQAMIYDRNDDLGSGGTITYTPFLTQPHASTPAP